MKLSGVFFFVLTIFSSVYAFEDLGKIDVVRKAHPEIFIPGSIHGTTINGKLSYVFAGQAEQCFSGEFAEPENELYEEAILAARNFFYDKLSNGDKTVIVTMSHCSVLYQFNDKKIYTVILFVPKDNVQISVKGKKLVTSTPVNVQQTSLQTIPAKRTLNAVAESHKPSSSKENATEQRPHVEEKKIIPSFQKVQPAISKASVIEKRKKKYISKIKKDPNDPISGYNLAKIYESEGSLEIALKYYRVAVNAASNDEFFDSEEKINMILSTAQLCEKIGKNNLALKYYYLLLKNNPSPKMRQIATQKISQVRLRNIE